MQQQVLRVDASMRRENSQSRKIADILVGQLKQQHARVAVTNRDLADGIRLIDERWIAANFTDPGERSSEQRSALAYSDALVEELRNADTLVIATPIYNFGIPAALKAWIDMVARARETFRYTANGPVGMLKGKKAYVIVTSGGTIADSPIDFATPYLRHALNFLGIHDVEVIAADGSHDTGALMAKAMAQIDRLRLPLAA